MVRMRSSRRTACTCFIAGCRLGAYRKQIPTSRRHWAAPSGKRWMFTPKASITSAEPHFELMLRLPCLATRTPAPAVTKAVAVEMLKVPLASPPVPLVSTSEDSVPDKSRCARSRNDESDSASASRPVPLTSSAANTASPLAAMRSIGLCSMGKTAAAARMASAKPTISSTVSPFIRSATSRAAIWASVHFPANTSAITSRDSARVSDWP